MISVAVGEDIRTLRFTPIIPKFSKHVYDGKGTEISRDKLFVINFTIIP